MTIAPILTRASAALDGGQPGSALDLLLTAWRTERRARIGPLLVALSRHLESRDARALRSTARSKTHAAWVALAGRCTEADRMALLDTLTQGTIAQAKKRLKIVEGWPADPRISATFLRWPVDLPFVSTSSQPAWNAAFRCLVTCTEPEALATIERLSHTGIASGGSMQEWMASSLPRLAKKMAKATAPVPDDAAAEAALEALRVSIVALTGADIAAPLAAPEVRLAAALAALPAPAPAPLSAHLTPSAAAAPDVEWVSWSSDLSRTIARISSLPELLPIFSESGDLLQSVPGADRAALSADGSRILLASGETLHLLSGDGTVLASQTITFPLAAEHRGLWRACAVVAHPARALFAVAFSTSQRLCIALVSGEDLTPQWLASRSSTRRRKWLYSLDFSLSGRFLYGGPTPLMVYDLTWQTFRQLADDFFGERQVLALPDGYLALTHRQQPTVVIEAASGWQPPDTAVDARPHELADAQRRSRLSAATPLLGLVGVTGGARPLGWIGPHLLHRSGATMVPLGKPLPASIHCALSVGTMVLIGLATRYDRLGSIHVRSLKTGERVAALEGHTSTVLCIAASTDRIATGAKDNSVRTWSRQWTEEQRLDGHSDGVTAVAFSADGALLASGGGDGLRIWELSTGSELAAVPIDGDICGLGWIGSTVILAAGSTVHCWSDGGLTQTALPATARHAAVRPGDVLVAACADGALWAVRPGGEPERLLDGFLRPPPLAFTEDGRLHIGGGHRQHHGALLSMGGEQA